VLRVEQVHLATEIIKEVIQLKKACILSNAIAFEVTEVGKGITTFTTACPAFHIQQNWRYIYSVLHVLWTAP
jgi:hypothetical protein